MKKIAFALVYVTSFLLGGGNDQPIVITTGILILSNNTGHAQIVYQNLGTSKAFSTLIARDAKGIFESKEKTELSVVWQGTTRKIILSQQNREEHDEEYDEDGPSFLQLFISDILQNGEVNGEEEEEEDDDE